MGLGEGSCAVQRWREERALSGAHLPRFLASIHLLHLLILGSVRSSKRGQAKDTARRGTTITNNSNTSSPSIHEEGFSQLQWCLYQGADIPSCYLPKTALTERVGLPRSSCVQQQSPNNQGPVSSSGVASTETRPVQADVN